MSDKKQILIVDSDSRVCEGLSAVFNKRGYITSAFADGDQAFEFIGENNCQLVLIDMNMPGLEVYRLTGRIQSMENQPLVIINTGINSVKSALRSLAGDSEPDCIEIFSDNEDILRVEKVIKKKIKTNQLVDLPEVITGERYRYLVENSPDIIYALDSKGRFSFVNNTIRTLLGFNQSDLFGKSYKTLIYKDNLEEAEHHFNERRTGARATLFKRIKLRYKANGHSGNSGKKNGYLEMSLKANGIYKKPPKSNGNGSSKSFLGTYGTIIDISTHQHPDLKEQTILENIEDGYFETDVAGNLVHFNNALCNIVGYTHDELMGMNYRQFVDEVTARNVFEVFSRTYASGKPAKPFDWVLVPKNKNKVYVETTVSPIKGNNHKVTGFCGIARNVSERKKKEEEIAYIAQHDYLTDLYNRNVFDQRLEDALNLAKRYKQEIALLFIDIDKFKTVNDTYGHEAGDKLLIEIARRLTASLRETDHIFRLGGDEFTTILNNPENLSPEVVAKKLKTELSKPYDLDGRCIDFVSASIGISIYPHNGMDAETLTKNADAAMYQAKQQRDGFVFYGSLR